MHSTIRILGALVLLLVPTLPATAQSCASAPGDGAAAAAVARSIVAADNDRDLEAVLAHYADDAVLLPPGEPAVHGVARIRPRYEALFAAYDPAILGHVASVRACGDLAVVRGRNTGVLRGRDGAPDRTLEDVFVMVLGRDADGWRITELIWHPGGA